MFLTAGLFIRIKLVATLIFYEISVFTFPFFSATLKPLAEVSGAGVVVDIAEALGQVVGLTLVVSRLVIIAGVDGAVAAGGAQK